MFKIAICDDEVSFQTVLREQIEAYYGLLEVEIVEFSSGMDLINQSTPIIFLTSHTEFAMEGYEVDAFRFLEKPLKTEKLIKAFQAFENLKLLDSKIELQVGEKIMLLNWTEIHYIQSENVYVNVYLEDTRYLIRKKLSDIQEQMPKQMFFRSHRSYLINLRFVKFFDGKKIIMKNGNEIPLSRGKRSEFKTSMMNYLHILG